MARPDNRHDLLLDLDALFDTRMGTLLQLHKPAGVVAVKNGYHTRVQDDFERLTDGLVTDKAYQDAYAARDIDTLKRSIVTAIPAVLTNHILSMEEQLLRGINVSSISITLNTYPYVLPGPVAQAMVEVLGTVIPAHVNLGITRYDPAILKPHDFRDQFDGWATYAYNDWFALHNEELLVRRANELTVILPRLHQRPPEEFRHEDEALNDLDKLNLHAMVMEEFIRLEYLPVADFCFFTPGTYSSYSPAPSGSESGSST